MNAISRARTYLHAHPSVIVALGLTVAALGQGLAGESAAAWNSLYSALGVLGVRLAAKHAA